jgi:hypothetical protein
MGALSRHERNERRGLYDGYYESATRSRWVEASDLMPSALTTETVAGSRRTHGRSRLSALYSNHDDFDEHRYLCNAFFIASASPFFHLYPRSITFTITHCIHFTNHLPVRRELKSISVSVNSTFQFPQLASHHYTLCRYMPTVLVILYAI